MFPVLTDPRCLDHGPFHGYPETPARLERILDHLRDAGWPLEEGCADDGARKRARRAVERLHDEDYVARFERAVARGDGLLDSADNPLSPGSAEAAWAAVEVALAAADRVMETGGPVFAAVRPPGHHAEADRAMGFCFFGTVAVAARHLQEEHGVGRVAIFDFDVHHGNGTQHLLEEDPSILYVSTHQFPFYPGTGAASERGVGAGEGATVNVPLSAGTGDEGYARALEDEVLPALGEFAPEVLVLSAGFDAWQGDPLAGMGVTRQGYRQWGERLGEMAAGVCDGRVLVALEGGYDLAALPLLVEDHLLGLERGLEQGLEAGRDG